MQLCQYGNESSLSIRAGNFLNLRQLLKGDYTDQPIWEDISGVLQLRCTREPEIY
jgi:hypothetical protein